jgi:hypothetical protein
MDCHLKLFNTLCVCVCVDIEDEADSSGMQLTVVIDEIEKFLFY